MRPLSVKREKPNSKQQSKYQGGKISKKKLQSSLMQFSFSKGNKENVDVPMQDSSEKLSSLPKMSTSKGNKRKNNEAKCLEDLRDFHETDSSVASHRPSNKGTAENSMEDVSLEFGVESCGKREESKSCFELKVNESKKAKSERTRTTSLRKRDLENNRVSENTKLIAKKKLDETNNLDVSSAAEQTKETVKKDHRSFKNKSQKTPSGNHCSVKSAKTSKTSSLFIWVEKDKQIDPAQEELIASLHELDESELRNISTVLSQGDHYYDAMTRLKAYKLLKQGQTPAAVAREIGAHITTTIRWSRMYFPEKEKETKAKLDGTKAKACELLRQGKTARAVARELGIDNTVVNYWRNKFVPDAVLQKRKMENKLVNLSDLDDGYKFSKSLKIKACKYMLEGRSPESVAEELGLTYTTVLNWRRKFLFEKRTEPKEGWKYDRNIIIEACNLLKEGKSYYEASKELGIPACAIQRWGDVYDVQKVVKCPKKSSNSEATDKVKLMDVSTSAIVTSAPKTDLSSFGFIRDTAKSSENSKTSGFKASTPKADDSSLSCSVESRAAKLDTEARDIVTLDSKSDSSSGTNLGDLSNCSKDKQRPNHKASKIFVPLQKVCFSRKMKSRAVKMMNDGVSIAKLSKKFNIDKLILQTWASNKTLLQKKLTDQK